MLQINGSSLTIEDVLRVARFGQLVSLDTQAKANMQQSSEWVQTIAKSSIPVYGINTGFGIFADRLISAADVIRLNRNLMLSHAVGTGPVFDDEIVRAAMLIRANTLSGGHSGVRPILVETLIAMLNRGVTPIIPSQGSMGSSGDLAPLAQMGLVFTCDSSNQEENSGLASFQGEILNGKSAMQAAGIQRVVLDSKEALGVTNGATFAAAIAALAVYNAQILLDTADVSLSMSLEALLGVSAAFDERIHLARRHPGQQTVAAHIRKLTQGSTLVDAAGRVQDAYSLRCAPQVQGAAYDTLNFVRQTTEREINAITDNPLIFGPDTAISGGNFHGEPIGMAMDFLSIALAEIGAIAERRVFRLTDGNLNNGLPPMLVDSSEAAGLNSGLMMPQYTAASLVLENQTLAAPDSVHSLPTSGEQEDHNANATTAARHALQIAKNTAHILAIEAYTAARAIDLRLRQYPAGSLGNGVGKAQQIIRSHVPYQSGDAWWGPEIARVKNLVLQGRLANILREDTTNESPVNSDEGAT